MKNSSCFSLTLTSYLFQEVFLKRKKAAVLCHKFALICIFETEFKVCLSVKCPKYKLHFGNSCISLLRQIIAHFIKIRWSIRNNTRRTLQSAVSVVAKYWKNAIARFITKCDGLITKCDRTRDCLSIFYAEKKEQMLCINLASSQPRNKCWWVKTDFKISLF